VLLDAGADVNARSPFGSALTMAAMAEHGEAARFLLRHGAQVKGSADRPDRITILMFAARAGDVELIRDLLRRGADTRDVDNNGSTALSYAARAGRTAAVRALLSAKSLVDAADSQGWTPLMHAAVNGHAETVKVLLAAGARPNAVDKQGRTPLLLVAGHGDHSEVIRLLLGRGARATAVDSQGRNARTLAEARGYTASARVLAAAGIRPVGKAPAIPTPRAAARQSLARVEQAMQVFNKRTGCVSCHHEGTGRYTLAFARDRGYTINAAFARLQEQRTLGTLNELAPQLDRAVADPAEIPNVPIVDIGDYAPTYGAVLLALEAHGVAPTPAIQAAATVLGRVQSPDGAWRFGLMRVPAQSSFFTTTAQAIRVLKHYAPGTIGEEVEERVSRARHWLATTPAPNTEDRVYRLLGLKWAGASGADRAEAIRELRASQRPDGGWGQLPGMASDAYATGSALFALAQGGDVDPRDPAYQRGIRFLLRTRQPDGSWYVYKRAMPANNYMDGGFPYGQSQYSSELATCWATLALILAADAPARSTAQFR
jgi:ankyrin repeat protein